MIYRNFDLELALDGNELTARVLYSPEGEEAGSAASLANLPAALDLVDAVTGVDEQLGLRLFPDAVGERWAAALATAEAAGEGLRLRLFLADDRVARVPWEAAKWRGRWLALDPHTPVVRYVRAGRPAPPAEAAEKPRLLAALVDTSGLGLPPLDLAAERAALQQALHPLEQADRLSVRWLQGAITFHELQDALREVKPHVVHLVGHGELDETQCQGRLYLARKNLLGKPRPHALAAEEIGLLLGNAHVRFAFLNACQSGRAAGGLAETLVKAGVPAALGMQMDVPDAAAPIFAGAFYRALADGWPVDAAAVEGRNALMGEFGLSSPLWVAPVLVMRSADGVLWRPELTPAAPEQPSQAADLPPSPSPPGDTFVTHVGSGASRIAIGKNFVQK